MPHEVDTMAFEISQAPWHIGETADRSKAVVGLQRGADMVVAAGLDWTVTKERITRYRHGPDGTVPLPLDAEQTDYYFTVRQDRDAVLGVVGPQYAVLQNRDAFALVDDILDDSGAKYETAGALRGGKIVWALARLPKNILVAGKDPVVPYMLVANSHDGSKRVTVTMTAVRVVCMNTLGGALPYYARGGHLTKEQMRHTPNTVFIVHRDGALATAKQRARDALDLSYRYFESFETLANELSSVTLTEGEFDTFLKQVIAGDTKQAEAKRAEVAALLDSPTNADFRGSAWGAFNALTEWYDHNTKGLREKTLVDTRFERAVLDLHGVKQDALDLLVELAHQKKMA